MSITVSPGVDGCVLTVAGVLDGTTYMPLRDAIVKAALDEPCSVVVDISDMVIRDESALAVFVNARWQISEWPDVPIGLVCAQQHGLNALRRNGVARYVPVYATLQSAITGLVTQGERNYRRRARATLPARKSSARRCRELVGEWLTAWSRADFIHVARVVATELVENALADTASKFRFRLEADGSTVAVAVQHASTALATRPEPVGDPVSAIDMIVASSRVWGSYTTAAGKTVWAVLGPENRF